MSTNEPRPDKTDARTDDATPPDAWTDRGPTGSLSRLYTHPRGTRVEIVPVASSARRAHCEYLYQVWIRPDADASAAKLAPHDHGTKADAIERAREYLREHPDGTLPREVYDETGDAQPSWTLWEVDR